MHRFSIDNCIAELCMGRSPYCYTTPAITSSFAAAVLVIVYLSTGNVAK